MAEKYGICQLMWMQS